MNNHDSIRPPWTEENGQTKWVITAIAVLAIALVSVPIVARKTQPSSDSSARAALSTATPAGPTTAASALPQNGGFEEGATAPTGWNQGQTVNGVTYVWSKDAAHSGAASIGFTKTERRYFPVAAWDQPIHLAKPAKSVTVMGWARAQQAYKAVIDVSWPGGHKWVSYIGAKNDGDPPANHDWRLYTGTVAFDSSITDFALGLQMYGPGAVLFDDVSVSVTE